MIYCIKCFENRFPDRGTLEDRMTFWLKDYQQKNVEFYKCILRKSDQAVKKKFPIQYAPSLIFILAGEQKSQLIDLQATNPKYVEQTKFGEENADEKRIKEILNNLCKTDCPDMNKNK